MNTRREEKERERERERQADRQTDRERERRKREREGETERTQTQAGLPRDPSLKVLEKTCATVQSNAPFRSLMCRLKRLDAYPCMATRNILSSI